MQSGKSGGFFERMLRGDDHQKEQIAGANPPQPLTDGNPTFNPSLYEQHLANLRRKDLLPQLRNDFSSSTWQI
jgi:hypothetical protein